MRDKFGSLHPHEKIRDRGELDGVNVVGQVMHILNPASVQQQDSRTVQRGVGNGGIVIPRQIGNMPMVMADSRSEWAENAPER